MNAGKVILGALTIIGLLADIIDSSEPVFFERVIRLCPSETTKNYVNRVVFGLLKYVRMCDDPIAINEFQRYFALILCRQSCKVVLPL